jgi:NADPH:quinone reductase-like Zn-dependent oxidoreductase
LDYARVDVTQDNQTYDLILDTVGNLRLQQCRKLLNPGGKLIAINVGLMANLTSVLHGDMVSGVAEETVEDLDVLKTLLEAGDIKPVVDKVFPMNRVVDAHRYLEAGQKSGNVVLTMSNSTGNGSVT